MIGQLVHIIRYEWYEKNNPPMDGSSPSIRVQMVPCQRSEEARKWFWANLSLFLDNTQVDMVRIVQVQSYYAKVGEWE